MDNEWEQANSTGRVVTDIWLGGPVALINRGDCSESWRHWPRAFRQGHQLSGTREAMECLVSAMVTPSCCLTGGVGPSGSRCGSLSVPSMSRRVPGAKIVVRVSFEPLWPTGPSAGVLELDEHAGYRQSGMQRCSATRPGRRGCHAHSLLVIACAVVWL